MMEKIPLVFRREWPVCSLMRWMSYLKKYSIKSTKFSFIRILEMIFQPTTNSVADLHQRQIGRRIPHYDTIQRSLVRFSDWTISSRFLDPRSRRLTMPLRRPMNIILIAWAFHYVSMRLVRVAVMWLQQHRLWSARSWSIKSITNVRIIIVSQRIYSLIIVTDECYYQCCYWRTLTKCRWELFARLRFCPVSYRHRIVSVSEWVWLLVTAVSLLTERDWRPLPLELVLGMTWNCTWGVGLAPPHPISRSQRRYGHLWIRSVGVPPPLPLCVGRRGAWRRRGKALGTPVCR